MVLAIDATGPVVKLDLNRPEKGNAATKAMMHEIIDAVRTHGANPQTRIIAVVARGDQFCSGREVGGGPSPVYRLIDQGSHLMALEQPEAVAETIMAFLKRLKSH